MSKINIGNIEAETVIIADSHTIDLKAKKILEKKEAIARLQKANKKWPDAYRTRKIEKLQSELNDLEEVRP